MKKKWYYKPGLSWERRKKFLLVFLLNVFLFFGVQAQTHRVTLNVKETSLEQVIKELEKQTGLQFFIVRIKSKRLPVYRYKLNKKILKRFWTGC